jgi:hypothetical protein
MNLEIQAADGLTIIRPKGPMNAITSPAMQEEINEALAGSVGYVDIRITSVMPSSGLCGVGRCLMCWKPCLQGFSVRAEKCELHIKWTLFPCPLGRKESGHVDTLSEESVWTRLCGINSAGAGVVRGVPDVAGVFSSPVAAVCAGCRTLRELDRKEESQPGTGAGVS